MPHYYFLKKVTCYWKKLHYFENRWTSHAMTSLLSVSLQYCCQPTNTLLTLWLLMAQCVIYIDSGVSLDSGWWGEREQMSLPLDKKGVWLLYCSGGQILVSHSRFPLNSPELSPFFHYTLITPFSAFHLWRSALSTQMAFLGFLMLFSYTVLVRLDEKPNIQECLVITYILTMAVEKAREVK